MKAARSRWIAFLTTTAVVALTVVSVPAVLHAQTEMRLKVPFDFYVGDQRFEPGEYRVLVSGAYIKVTGDKGHSRFALTNPVANPEWRNMRGGVLVFTHYDNYYFLSEVRREGYSFANGLIKVSLEVQAAKISTTRELIAFRTSP